MIESLTRAYYETSFYRWYAALNTQERMLVRAGSSVLLVLILIFNVWLPVSNWNAAEIQRYHNSENLLAWIKANEPRARKIASSTSSSPGANSLLALISSSAKASTVNLLRFQEEGGGGVSVVLQDQSFNDVLVWLERLEKRHRIQIRQISIDAHAKPGKINARVLLI